MKHTLVKGYHGPFMVSIATMASHVHCHLHMAKFHAQQPPWRSQHTLPTAEFPGERRSLPPRALRPPFRAPAERFLARPPHPSRLPRLRITNALQLCSSVSATLAPGEIPRAHSLGEEQRLGSSFVESRSPVPCQQDRVVYV